MGDNGFTLLGVAAVLAALSLGAAILAPLLFLDITLSKEEATREKLARLVEVIAGIPEAGTFGFIGDVGRVPKNLEELNDKNTTAATCATGFNPSVPPTFSIVTLVHPGKDGVVGTSDDLPVGQLGMGWRGPYFREMVLTDEHLRDAWGRTLRYTCPETTKLSTDPTTGGVALTLRTGQITSAGPDGAFDTGDDIKAEAFHDKGHLFLTVVQGGADHVARHVTVNLYFPVNGAPSRQASEPTLVDAPEGSERTIVFASVPQGVRFAQIDFGIPDWERYHLGLKSNIANRIAIKIPLGPGGKK